MSFDASKKNKKRRALAQRSPACFDNVGNSDPHKGGHPRFCPYRNHHFLPRFKPVIEERFFCMI